MMSLLLWGGLACVFSLGINDLTTVFFDIFGVGVLAAPIIAPLVEELFKGIGLVAQARRKIFDRATFHLGLRRPEFFPGRVPAVPVRIDSSVA